MQHRVFGGVGVEQTWLWENAAEKRHMFYICAYIFVKYHPSYANTSANMTQYNNYYVSELSPLEVPTVLAIGNAGNTHTKKKNTY